MEQDRRVLGRQNNLKGHKFQSKIAGLFGCTDLKSNFAPDLLCQRPCEIIRVEVKKRAHFTRTDYTKARDQPTNRQTNVFVTDAKCSKGANDQAKLDGKILFCEIESLIGQVKFHNFLKSCDK